MAPAAGSDCISNHPNKEEIIHKIFQRGEYLRI